MPAMISHGAIPEPNWTAGHDCLAHRHPRVALAILERVAHLVGDHRRGGNREAGARLRRKRNATPGRVGAELRLTRDGAADAQHLAARVVVIGELAGHRLDLHVAQALPIEQPSGEVEGRKVDAGVDLAPLGVCRTNAPRRPAGDREARQHHQQQVRHEVVEHRFGATSLEAWRVYPSSVKLRVGRIASAQRVDRLSRGAPHRAAHGRAPRRGATRRRAWPACPRAAPRPAPARPGRRPRAAAPRAAGRRSARH